MPISDDVLYICAHHLDNRCIGPTVDIYYNSTIIFLVPQIYYMQAVSAETSLSVFLLSSINEIVLYCIKVKISTYAIDLGGMT